MPEPKESFLKNSHWLNLQRIQKWTWALLILFLIMIGFFFKTHILSESSSAKPARDFIAFWSAADLATHGTPELAYDSKALHETSKAAIHNAPSFQWLYPPSYQLLMTPAALVDYKTAYFCFMALTLSLMALAAYQVIWQPAFFLPIAAFPASYVVIIFGQNSLLTTALATLSMVLLGRYPLLAGIPLGLLTIKPHVAIMFMFALVLGRYWHALATAIMTSAILASSSWLIMGDVVWVAFIDNLPSARYLLENGLLKWQFMTSVFVSAKQIGFDNTTAYLMHGTLTVIMTSAMAIIWIRSGNLNLKAASAAVATLTFSPYMFEYELMLLAIPLMFLIKDAMCHGWLRFEREILAFTWLFPLFNFIQQANFDINISATPIVAILLMLLIIRRACVYEREASSNAA